MAVEDKYVVTDDGDMASVNTGAGSLRRVIISFEVAAADDDGSKYRLMRNLPSESIISNVLIANDVITGGTDYDLGFYDTESLGGAVIDADALLDGGDLSSGHASGSELSGISAVDVANRGKTIWSLLGKTQSNKAASYDLVLTANTVGTAAGTITAIVDFIAV
jgi:hypothetical protein